MYKKIFNKHIKNLYKTQNLWKKKDLYKNNQKAKDMYRLLARKIKKKTIKIVIKMILLMMMIQQLFTMRKLHLNFHSLNSNFYKNNLKNLKNKNRLAFQKLTIFY